MFSLLLIVFKNDCNGSRNVVLAMNQHGNELITKQIRLV